MQELIFAQQDPCPGVFRHEAGHSVMATVFNVPWNVV
jgi:hypothetical protein